MEKSLNDVFVEYQVFKEEMSKEMKDAPGHIRLAIKNFDGIIRRSIEQARSTMIVFRQAYETGLEAGREPFEEEVG